MPMMTFRPAVRLRAVAVALVLVCTGLCTGPGPGRSHAASSTMLGLHASGSMWGQIDGEPKIAIAKRVLADVLEEIPADRRLGLVAYGHRRAGDCKDIEIVAPLGADRAAIRTAAEKLNAKGKTPMADAVRLAAEKLRYRDEKATVILVSDGIETCVPDPCAVAAALEAAGVELTVHVVGFDVREENEQAQLRCIAENTGGVFVTAADAAELGEALRATVLEQAAAPVAPAVVLRATELEGGVEIEDGLRWTVTPAGGGKPALVREDVGRVEAELPPGTYDVRAVRTADGLAAEQRGVVVQPQASKTVTLALTFPVEAEVRPESEDGVAGVAMKVHWKGPDRRGDFVSIAKKGGSDAEHESYAYVRLGNPVELRLPVEPGTYEVRYVLGRPLRVLARTELRVAAAAATLDAPDSVAAGAEVKVHFTAPPAGASDYVTVTTPGAPDTEYGAYTYSRIGSPATLRMPLEPGEYEIRFVQAGKKVLARRPISVGAAIATLSAKHEAVAGETVAVAFTGPKAGAGDYVTVTEPDAPPTKYTSYAYARVGSPAQVRMPLAAGSYELRYVQGGKKVLARQPIAVTKPVATLRAPDAARAGEVLAVEFTGPPPGSGDYVVVAEPGADDAKYLTYAYTKSGSPAQLRMPKEPGAYELRFIQGAKLVLARRPIQVTPPD